MTTPSPSPSVDPVRERIAEIQQRIAIGKERAEEDTGDGDAIISAWSMFAAVAEHDTPALVAALTAVLDLADEATYSVPPSLYEVGTSWVSSEIRRRAAAGLGVTP